MSCPSAALCLAATYFGYQLVWDGSSWSTAVQLDPAGGSGPNLSCTVTQFCVVTDQSGPVTGA